MRHTGNRYQLGAGGSQLRAELESLEQCLSLGCRRYLEPALRAREMAMQAQRASGCSCRGYVKEGPSTGPSRLAGKAGTARQGLQGLVTSTEASCFCSELRRAPVCRSEDFGSLLFTLHALETRLLLGLSSLFLAKSFCREEAKEASSTGLNPCLP